MVVEEEHHLAATVHEGAVVQVIAQEDEILQVGVYLREPRFELICRLHFFLCLLEETLLVNCAQIANVVVEIEAQIRLQQTAAAPVKVLVAAREPLCCLQLVQFCSNLHVKLLVIPRVDHNLEHVFKTNAHVELRWVQRVP